MHIRMPGSISLAPQGGTCPILETSKTEIKITSFIRKGAKTDSKESRLRQPTLRWPTEKVENDGEQTKGKITTKEQDKEERGTYVRGSSKEDNQRYKEFLEYCEEK